MRLRQQNFYVVTVSKKTATYAELLAVAVSPEYAMGPESVSEMTPYWRSMPRFNQVILGLHAFLASICLLIGPFSLSQSLRERRPLLHRRLGKAYFGLGIPAMILSMIYLSITPMDRVYGGKPFAIGLWGIAVLTLYTMIMGLYHIRRGEVLEHKRIMILNFAAIIIAPFLRLWWLLFGLIFSGHAFDTQAITMSQFSCFLVCRHSWEP